MPRCKSCHANHYLGYRVDGRKISQLRVQKEFTVKDFAALIGVNPVTIYRTELGLTTPYPSTLCKIANVLGVGPAGASLQKPTVLNFDD